MQFAIGKRYQLFMGRQIVIFHPLHMQIAITERLQLEYRLQLIRERT